MRYALIKNNIVTNIIELDKQNEKYFPNAICTDNIPVGVGDTYTDGKFYRDRIELKDPLDESYAEIKNLTTQLADAVEIIYNNDMEVIENV